MSGYIGGHFLLSTEYPKKVIGQGLQIDPQMSELVKGLKIFLT